MITFIPNKETFFNFLQKRLETVDLKLDDIKNILEPCLDLIYARFNKINNKYYYENNKTLLHTGHNSQMVLFFYELSRQSYIKYMESVSLEEKELYKLIADKLYYLKIADTGCNIIYSIYLPDNFFCDHPISSVIGRAIFTKNSSLVLSNNCSIGNNKNIYPHIKGSLLMFPNSTLVGNVKIEGMVVLSNGCYIKDEGTIRDKLVFGRSPNLIFKDLSEDKKKEYNKFLC